MQDRLLDVLVQAFERVLLWEVSVGMQYPPIRRG
jgi:hypothetical protein